MIRVLRAAVLAAGWTMLATSACASRGQPEIVTLRPDDPDLEPLSWLAGHWVGLVEGARVEEHWTQPSGGTMLGMNRTVVGARTVFFEHLRIEHTPEGIVLVASPMGRPPTRFRLVAGGEHEAVFENPEHDFPRRIVYRRDGNVLHARIEGVEAGHAKVVTWTFVRARFPDA